MQGKIFAILAMAIFMFGCTDIVQKYAENEVNGEGGIHANQVRTLAAELTDLQEATCNCLLYESNSTSPWWTFGLFESAKSLKGAKLKILPECTYESLEKALEENSNATLKTFMLGSGTTFTDFNYANAHCREGMDMAVKWLGKNGSTEYIIPKPERAGCMMDNQVIPVYVLYSGGKAVNNIESARKVAESLNGLGPAIITSEINYDSKDVAAVAAQVKEMKKACSECMIALAPKMGNAQDMNAVMGIAGQSVDLFAVGVDSLYFNDTIYMCSPSQLLYTARNFSQYGLATYGKYSIFPYMAVREGDIMTYKNPDTDQVSPVCAWEPNSNAMMSSFFFLTDIRNVLADGVIGAARYDYTGAFDPLNCGEKCSEAYPDYTKDNGLKNNEPIYSHWYGFCELYAQDDPSQKPNKIFAEFPTFNRKLVNGKYVLSSGGCANSIQNFRFEEMIGDDSPYKVNTDYTNPKPIPMGDVYKPYFSCDYCAMGGEEIPFDSVTAVGGAGDLCSKFTEINVYADRWEVDPWLAKAFAAQEAGIGSTEIRQTYCSVSYPVSVTNGGCNANDLLQIADPDGTCNDPANNPKANGQLAADYTNVKAEDGSQGKPCAYGLMQTIELPHTYWDMDKPDASESSGGGLSPNEVSKACFADFNPFNGTQSACLGVYKIYKSGLNVDSQLAKLTGNSEYNDKLGLCDDDGTDCDEAKLNAWKIIIMRAQYAGLKSVWNNGPGEWMKKYFEDCDSGDSDGECEVPVKVTKTNADGSTYEETEYITKDFEDFPDYLANCIAPTQNIKTALDIPHVLSYYKGLTGYCQYSDCPYGKLSKNRK